MELLIYFNNLIDRKFKKRWCWISRMWGKRKPGTIK